MLLKVSFKDFWAGFNPHDNLLLKLTEQAYGGKVEVVDPRSKNIDLEFRSVFTFGNKLEKMISYGLGQISSNAWNDYVDRSHHGFSRNSKGYTKTTVWYTGENIRAPRGIFDLTLSYDPTDISESNVYFPVWFFSIDWFRTGSNTKQSSYDINDFLVSRNLEPREKIACAFSSSREPSRLALYDAVECEMRLDKFGSAWGNRIADKNLLAKNYGLQVCPENDLYPGYVTEKLFEAYASGTIPIWRGLDRDGIFNKKAFIDCTDLSYSELIERIRGLTDDVLVDMRNQPLLNQRPSIQPVILALRKVIESGN
jgi:hypothetical protein